MYVICIWMSSAIMSVSSMSVQFNPVGDIVRDLNGDLFSVRTIDCRSDECAGNGKSAEIISSSVRQCRCRCSDSHPVFREDHNQCVNQLDCPLVAFIRPHLTEHIPVVSLPVSSGQLIHPGAQLIIGVDSGINHSKQLLCQIDTSNVMTPEGWQPIRQKDGSQAFELFEDGNHTFLQWLATDSLRQKLYQRLVMIGLICSAIDSSVEINIYRPCIAMRVGWVPGLGVNKESSDLNKTDSGHNANYLMIGLCLALLAIIYVSALMVYMRNKHSSEQMIHKDRHITTRRLRSDSEDSRTIGDIMSINTSNNSVDNLRNYSSSENDSYNQRSGNDSPEWTPDLPSIDYNSPNNSEDENQTTKAETTTQSKECQSDATQNPIYDKILQKPERIPRLCLRISPELFEPKLLQNPPPTALEMLKKIRDLISIAKSRLRNFRFRPTLVVIPEDDYFYNEFSLKSVTKGMGLQNESLEDCHDFDVIDEKDIHIIRNESQISCDRRPEPTTSAEVMSETNHKVCNNFPKIIAINEKESFKISDNNMNESDIRSVSRKKIVNDMQIQFFNDLNYDNKTNILVEKSISGKNLSLDCEQLETDLSPDIHSDLERHLSSKVRQNLYKTFENQIFDKKGVESSDNRMVNYFKNSLGRLSSKSKTKSDPVIISSNNWTLQTVTADKRHRQRNMSSKSVIRKRMATRRGQICYNCSDSSLSKHQTSDTVSDFDPKTSLESNENNETIDSIEFYTNSDSEMSTTSSTVRDNPFTSLESEINEDLNHNYKTCGSDGNAEENSPIDECLKYLAAASVDTTAKNHDKYYSRIGRASKGMSAIKKLRSSQWNHVCHRSDSELESSEHKTDSKTNFYSKSQNKSSKSLNTHNRQKFKKKLALYKSQSNEALNRSDDRNHIQDISHTSDHSSDETIDEHENNFIDIKTTEEVVEQMVNKSKDDLSAHFVIKIKI